MIRLILLLLLPVSIFGASSVLSSSGTGSRLLLREIESKDVTEDAAVDLNGANLDSVLKQRTERFAIVEFFANWCPACRNYKPHYEKVARVFNGLKAAYPGVIFMARVDCALKENSDVCDNFTITHYPTLFWGPPLKFGSGWKPEEQKSGVIPIEDAHTADLLLGWINKQLGSSYGFDDDKFANVYILSNASHSEPVAIAEAVHDVEEATAMAFDIITEHKMIKPETRGAMTTFLQLLAAHHPTKRCRMGSAGMLVDFDDIFPSTSIVHQSSNTDKKEVPGDYKICGNDVPTGHWMFCRGSRKDTRGFSCGLWVLLHSLSVRVEDVESQFAFNATCEFIHKFFVCEECRQHFYQMCLSVPNQFTKARDYALWLWLAHNKVNERLMIAEANLRTIDPKFPKVLWPPKQLCSSCSSTITQNGTTQVVWDKEAVYMFLSHYYGKKLVSLVKEKDAPRVNTTVVHVAEETVTAANPIILPIRPALAIALASCAFGALAYLWRLQLKNQKYSHHFHSYKNV